MQTYRGVEAYNPLHAAVILDKLTLPQLIGNSPHFMEAKVSLAHSKAPTTCPYTEPDQSSPCPSFYFLQIHSNIILPSTPGSSKCSLPPCFPIKTLYAPLLSLHTYHITHPLQCSPLPCYPVPFRPQNLPQPLILEHPQSMLLNCTTSRTVAGSISDGAIDIFH